MRRAPASQDGQAETAIPLREGTVVTVAPRREGAMARFVILEHDHPSLHWDLMLEVAEVLQTWRLSAPPGEGPVSAERSFDHRLIYLDHEGPISGGRGRVSRWDHGAFRWARQEEGAIVVELEGG